MEQNFVFQITPLDVDALVPQVSQALEMRTNILFQTVCPRLSALADRLNKVKKVPAQVRERRRRSNRVLGLINWIMATLILPVAILPPDGSTLLAVVGGLCLGTGVVSLWRYLPKTLGVLSLLAGIFFLMVALGGPEEMAVLIYLAAQYFIVGLASLMARKRRDPFDRAARKLLRGRDRINIAEHLENVQVVFSEQGMTLATPEGEAATFPYPEFERVLETSDIFLVICGKRAMVLQKKGMIVGTLPELRAFLQKRVDYLELSA